MYGYAGFSSCQCSNDAGHAAACTFSCQTYIVCTLQAPAVRKAAEHAGQAFIEMLNPYTTGLVLPHLFSCFDGRRNWQVSSCRTHEFANAEGP